MLTFREFNYSDQDYATIVAIHDAVIPDEPANEMRIREVDRIRPKNRYFHRFIGEIDAVAVGYGYCVETFWNKVPDQYSISWSTLKPYRNQGVASEFYSFALQKIHDDERKLQSIIASTTEDLPEGIRWLENNGFESTVRYMRSDLNLADFDPSKFADYATRAANNGLVIKPLSQIIPNDPLWQHKLWELDWILEQDEPHDDPPARITFDEYVKSTLGASNFDADMWFIALDREHYAGLTILYPDKAKPDMLLTDWTGVDRPYRRQGLAMAMKLASIEYVLNRGDIVRIRTDNHEDNWMYQINLRLGFKPIPADIGYIQHFTE